MAAYNRDLKFIYLFEPHTASRATLVTLQEHVKGTANIQNHHINMEGLTNWRRLKIPKKDALMARVIATVRNPLDTIITRWRFSGFKDISFERFVMTNKNHQSVINSGMGLYLEAEYFCWYEDLEADLQWMFNRPEMRLHSNTEHKTPNKEPWWVYYQDKPDLFEFLAETHRPYCERFGYQLEWVDDRPVCEIDQNTRIRLCQQLL